MNILQAIDDPELFAPWFKKRDSYRAWFAFLAAIFALPMTEEQEAIYRKHTGRQEVPTEPAEEAWLIIGRRGGKSFIMALIAVYLACFEEYEEYLAPGEVATVIVIAADRRQARSIMRYARAMLEHIPLLSSMVAASRTESIDLINRVTIEVGTASYRTTRGYTYVACLCDELAFWPTEDSANPDQDIIDALRPGMGTIPNSKLICASSPHARKGALWDAFKRYWGVDGPNLVWKAATREMNPSFRQSEIDKAYENDEAKASAEYGGEFRRDIEAFVSREVIEAAIMRGVTHRGYDSRFKYFAFVDPTGGSNDSFTLAIAHMEKDVIFLDHISERVPPLSPKETISDFCRIIKAYGIREVTGDNYGGEFPKEQFRSFGVSYKRSERSRSDLYREMLPMLNSGKLMLLDHPKLFKQIMGLERRVFRGGKEAINHAPGSHDDIANAVAGVASIIEFVKRAPVAATGATRRN